MGKVEIVIALNTSSVDTALKWVDTLKEEVNFFKVGLPLFVSFGKKFIEKLKKRNSKIFLDLKLCDIPSVVKETVKEISTLGVDVITVHTMGGSEMLKVARDSSKDLKIIGVTLLTSLSEDFLRDTLSSTIEMNEMVLNLSHMAREAGLDGVVASGREVKLIKKKFGKSFMVVVPGVRLKGEEKYDQKRTISPGEVARDGADIIVVGRPVTHSVNPIEVIKKYKKEIEESLSV